jgi:trehalose 6-phosphate synthase/phosphatase
MKMARLLIVSNRLPVQVVFQKNKLLFQPSVGGLATGIASLEKPKNRIWLGWPGIASDRLHSRERKQIVQKLRTYQCRPVFLSSSEVRDFYFGFSNRTVWPLFHYFPSNTVFDESYWKGYQKVNEHFCRELLHDLKPTDKVWIHDYQLMLLPGLLRAKCPTIRIGFFLHIPFPSFELLRLLPWREELLEGLLGADLIGFHEYDYVRHFLSSVYRLVGIEPQLNHLIYRKRLIQVDAFPMGIDYDRFANSSQLPEVAKEMQRFQRRSHQRLILSVDRLDYTKGILKRLEGYEVFLNRYSQFHGKVSLLMIVVPSRSKVDEYSRLREQIERQISRINGEYGTIEWTPVSYLYRSLPFERLCALYAIADVALITPLRDGMNLVAKEYVACQKNKHQPGVLILSEMAGASSELAEALVVNPFSTTAIADSLQQALDMPNSERIRRNQMMQERLKRYTVMRWANDFLHSLDQVKINQSAAGPVPLDRSLLKKVRNDYLRAPKRLFLLDYDGTLVPFFNRPEEARPDPRLLRLLKQLTEDPNNQVILISGRNRQSLDEWFSHLKMILLAEHGAYQRNESGHWKVHLTADTKWKETIRPILELYVDRTPGAFVEEKTYSLVWHCRKSEPELARLRIQSMKETLSALAANLNIGVFEGRKIVEVKPYGINKGYAVLPWLELRKWSFILAGGDDYTDEDLFTVLPPLSYSFKIGPGISRAVYRVNTVDEFRSLLTALTRPSSN